MVAGKTKKKTRIQKLIIYGANCSHKVLVASWHGPYVASNADKVKLLTQLLHEIISCNKDELPVIIGGDFNLTYSKICADILHSGFEAAAVQLSPRKAGQKWCVYDGFIYKSGRQSAIEVRSAEWVENKEMTDHDPISAEIVFRPVTGQPVVDQLVTIVV